MSLSIAAMIASPALAYHDSPVRVPGPLIDVSIEVAGRTSPLYAAIDGSEKRYVEAERGKPYAVRIQNRSAERVAVELRIDGLNAISGKESGASVGRMYVLGPRTTTTIRGWRTSLEDVRRFEFVDEERSYAARTSQANARMGWIEISAYREWAPPEPQPIPLTDARRGDDRAEAEGSAAPRSAAPARRFPGTGWGHALEDRAQLVEFVAEPQPTQTVILRYEYEPTLRALGVLPPTGAAWSRLAERESGASGFAPAPNR
jgi:hypothetical protein